MRDSTPPREERILNELKDVMRDLGGLEPDKIDVQATFLQLGFDSLFLAQASIAFKKRFGVEIVFRQLLEEAPTLDALAGYIDAQLPPDKPPVSTPRPVETVLGTSPPAQTRPQRPDSPSVVLSPMDKLKAHEVPTSSLSLERIISQQVQVMAAQLEMLRHCEARSPSLAPPVAVFTEPSNGRSGESSGNGATTVKNRASAWTSAPDEERKSVRDAKRFGPWKPIDRSSVQNMEARQKRHLDDLISRYTARTRRSKELTQSHRPHLADPRAVAGFRTAWKEMVYPIVAERSSGSKLWDIDGNEYIDLTMGFGSILLGHSPGFVTQALRAQIEKGIEIGPQSPLAGEVARLVTELTGMERVTYCNTGSEAVLAALRVARTVSGRNKIALFTGSYHGIFDEVLVRAANTGGKHHAIPVAPGIPPQMVEHVVLLEYGNPESIEVLKDHAEDLAAVLVEPVQSRHPDLQPREFLHALREWTKKAGVALIFDEVITGFRLHPGGAQAWFGIQADLATYGKIVGGGMPIGLLAGKANFMDALDGGMWSYGDGSLPEAAVTYFAGTFVRHPLALAAAAAVLNHLKEQGPELQQRLNERASRLAGDLNAYFRKTGVPIHLENCASMFHFSFLDESPFASLFFFHLREKGLHIWEGRPISISTAHTDDDLAFISRVVKESARELQEAGFFPRSLADPITRGDPVSEETPVVWSGATGFREGITNGSSRTAATTQKEAASREYPLTESQMEIWLATRFGDSASQAFNENILLRLKGKLDANGMRWAIQQVVDRHDALRTTFSPDGDCQRVALSLPVEIPYLDLSHLDRGRRERELETLLTGKFQQPFDLVKGPLVRARILKLEAEEHLLLLTAHHIVCDGWSIHVILQDLSSLYSAACRGAQADLPVATQFGEYALWQQRQQQSPEGRETEQFWLDQFSGPIPVLELPTDRPRPPFQTFQGSQQRICIDDSIYAGIKRLGASKGCTAFTTFLAAFKVLLYRLTAQEDIVVGIGMAGQSLAGNNILVGHCVNTLPLRSRIDGNQSFIESLQSLHKLLLDAYEHSNYTFGSLLKKLNTPRDASRTPLMSAMFNMDQELQGVRFGDLETELCPDPNPYYNFDLFFNIFEKRGRLILECEYNADLFDPETIRRWITHYQTMLEGIVANPEQRVSELPLLTEAEKHQLLVEWKDSDKDYPRNQCLHQLFEAQVERSPNAVAVIFPSLASGPSEDKQLTYRELNHRANQLAHYLRSLGVGPEVLVGICMERSLEMVVGLLGILKAGGAYVPVDPAYPRERVHFMLEDAEVSILLTQKRLSEEIPRRGMQVIYLDTDWKAIAKQSEENPHHEATSDNLAYMIYTSGSTGNPKGVLITHRNLVHSTSARVSYYAGPVENFLLIPSFVFDSSVAGIFWTLCQGGTLVLAQPGAEHDASQMAELIETRRISHLLCLPSLYALFLAQAKPGQLVSLKTVIVAGEACELAIAERHQELLPQTSLFNEYGPTEGTVWSTVYPYTNAEHKSRQLPIGAPISNSQIYVLDAYMQPVPIGVPGEILIGGPGVARGYLNRPELTAEKFIPNPFNGENGARLYKTGDLSRQLPDGNIEFLGRIDNQVKIRGFRIEPGEIEAVLSQHAAVKEAIVVSREDVPGEKRLVAYLVPSKNSGSTTSEFRGFLRQKLPGYMIPSAFVLLESLPLTPNGKLDRKALPQPDMTKPELEATFVPPRTAMEKVIAEIWAQVLGLERVGIQDNFFELGGHSLFATQVASRIRGTFGVELPLRRLFEAPTIAALVAALLKEEPERVKTEKTAFLLPELTQLAEIQVERMLDE